MPTEIVMPQMGESIAEGTIVRWLKNVGDPVERDEPLFEISTDKVDAEIPSPAAGVLSEIRAKEGETVPVNSVVAIIVPTGARSAAPTATFVSTPQGPPGQALQAPVPSAPAPLQDAIRQRSSPLVRKMAKEHDIDISTISGTGASGRVTRDDLLTFLQGRPATAPPAGSSPLARPGSAGDAAGTGLAGQTVPMSVMRRQIAEHMVNSRRMSAHVHSIFEIDFGSIDEIRQAKKAEYDARGAKLTYLSFILKAVAGALSAVPVVNASVDGDRIVYHKAINIGVAVSLDWGLIVPVVKAADQKSLVEVSRAIADLARRARAKQLTPGDVAGGTFTVSNPGASGAIVGMPIINQPQVAIVSVGAVQKRVVVIDDAMAIRPMAFLALGFDHRVIDGAVADQFLQHVQHTLEHWDPADA